MLPCYTATMKTKTKSQVKNNKPNVTGILKDPIFKPSLIERLKTVSGHREDARDFIQDVIEGTHKSVMIFGNPGTGKTTLVQTALEANGLMKGRDYLVARSHITPSQLYIALYHTRRQGQFLVMDDCDTILSSEIGLNMLKAATDQTFREMRYDSTYALKGVIEEVPKSFEFNGTVIITTNIIPKTGKSRMAQHMEAIRSRCVPFALHSENNMDAYAHLFYMVYENDMLAREFPDLAWDKKVTLLKFILNNIDSIRKLDLRKPGHIIRTMLKHPDSWERKALRILKTG